MTDQERQIGIVLRGIGGLFGVRLLPLSGDGETILCRARGVFRHEKISPLPGDIVYILPADEGEKRQDGRTATHVIDEILPRKNALIRPPLANLTHLFLAIPAANPTPDLPTADKLIAIAEAADIEPIILVTKKDISPNRAEEIRTIYQTAGFPVFTLEKENEEEIAALKRYLFTLSGGENTVIAAFSGASGVGKSTLLTKLFPHLSLKTGEISRRAERGRQTTRQVELFLCTEEGRICLFADTPGFSILDFTRFHFFDPAETPEAFREFRPFLGHCRYTKCTHTKEEGCAILEAVRRGDIPKERHKSYVDIFTEMKKTPDWKRRKEESNL